MKKLLVLGSTGSIGVNTLNVVDEFSDRYKIEVLSTYRNIDLLETQIKKFKPSVAVVIDPEKAEILKTRSTGDCKILTGSEALIEVSRESDYDIFVNALVGFSGLAPTIEAIKLGKRIALANKETLVVAGEIINNLLKEYNSEMIPVDSEHSAIFQCLVGENSNEIKKLIVTASGGPFLARSLEELENVTIEDALNHPNWKMGSKITIDSATMMNKGLEVIEAHWLFNLPKEKIDVVVHPQSIIHSMVEFVDCSIKAQLSLPDMKLPIQYAITYPERLSSNFVETDFFKLQNLTFIKPDMEKFRCLKLAYDVMEQGGTAACTLNAANEVAVDWFLNGKIKFTNIPEIIEDSLENVEIIQNPDLETIFYSDRQTREYLRNSKWRD
ncbi:MAG: 1-deoxy-D-xylulose-5-phosphate reductoisomerase [Rhodothermaceae bacterium]